MNKYTEFGGPLPAMAFLLVAGVVAMALTASQTARAGGSGECITARVDAPFHLPDGALYPAGALTLCDGGTYSPAHGFQRIAVQGSTVGLFVSNRRNAEVPSLDAPQILFTRDAEGNLSLIGYTVPSKGQSVAFRSNGRPRTSPAIDRPPTGGSVAEPSAAIVAATRTR